MQRDTAMMCASIVRVDYSVKSLSDPPRRLPRVFPKSIIEDGNVGALLLVLDNASGVLANSAVLSLF